MTATTYTAVLDRFEDDEAVLLLEKDGETVDELLVDSSVLPDEGRQQDAVFEVTLAGEGELTNLDYDRRETEERSARSQDRFDRLARRPPESDDQGNSDE